MPVNSAGAAATGPASKRPLPAAPTTGCGARNCRLPVPVVGPPSPAAPLGTWPHTHTLPSAPTAALVLRPAATAKAGTTRLPRTGPGRADVVPAVVLSPSWPLALLPQPYTAPSRSTNKACAVPAAAAKIDCRPLTARGAVSVAVDTSTWPHPAWAPRLLPQPATVPLRSTANCTLSLMSMLASATTSVRPGIGCTGSGRPPRCVRSVVPSAPASLWPQPDNPAPHCAATKLVSAAASAATFDRPGTSAGTLRTAALPLDVPSPACPL